MRINSIDDLIKIADKLPGGKGDDLDIDKIPEKELEKGKKVESEHTPNKELQEEIVADHEQETYEMTGEYNYYEDYLIPMEKEMKKEKKQSAFAFRLVSDIESLLKFSEVISLEEEFNDQALNNITNYINDLSIVHEDSSIGSYEYGGEKEVDPSRPYTLVEGNIVFNTHVSYSLLRKVTDEVLAQPEFDEQKIEEYIKKFFTDSRPFDLLLESMEYRDIDIDPDSAYDDEDWKEGKTVNVDLSVLDVSQEQDIIKLKFEITWE